MGQGEVVIDDEDDDEFEPLFSYQRVCRPPSDDDSDGDVTVIDGKGLSLRSSSKVFPSSLVPTCSGKRVHEDVTKKTEEDDDWLPPPPKNAKVLLDNKINEDPTLRELRQAKEELKRLAESRIEEDKLTQKSALQLHEASANAGEEPNPASSRREKVLVAIQNKDGVCKSFRQLKDEKFEKLFLKYAEWIGVPSQQLVFIFDGQKILEHQTPKDFDIEDEDIIEVNMKK